MKLFFISINSFSSVFNPRQSLPPILLRDSITMLMQLLMSAPHNLPSGKIKFFEILFFDILV